MMNANIIYLGQRSATFELQNDLPYYNDSLYNVYINGEIYIEGCQLNVVSIYDLHPQTKYKVEIKSQDESTIIEFETKSEYVTLDVKRFGAKGDGVTDDTLFIQSCINACPKNGRVLIPRGTYSVLPLFLKSDITIELQEGAHLLGNTDRNKYPILPGMTLLTDESDDYNLGSWEGNHLIASQVLLQVLKYQM